MLIQRYDKRVLSMAMSYAGDPDDAKDICQEVFIRVFRALPRFEYRSQFSTWLYRIAANVCKTYHSRGKKRRTVSLDQSLGDTGSPSLKESLAGGEAADQKTSAGEIASQIQEALGQLSPKQRIVFILRHYQGYKLREIAVIMDCAQGTVKRHLFSATRRLREQLSVLAREELGHEA
jgi:RNA polymerase sigma-70 factor (ECF subfamily)